MLQDLTRLLQHAPSPLQELQSALLSAKAVRLFVKRDDLLALLEGSACCGNKWRKLQYNLLEARRQGQQRLLTFGGAFSNHIAAVAEAGQAFGFKTIGVIRGEAPATPGPTLQLAATRGMHLHHVSRSDFRRQHDPLWIAELLNHHGNCYILPEGGTNPLALDGCKEVVQEIREQYADTPPHYYCVACGTGGTMAGMVEALQGQAQVLGFSALKGDFMRDAVAQLLRQHTGKTYENWAIQSAYHFGGYARVTPQLKAFANAFQQTHGITLDLVYTAKMFFGLFDLIVQDYFPAGSSIVAVHTGGLQGNAGFADL